VLPHPKSLLPQKVSHPQTLTASSGGQQLFREHRNRSVTCLSEDWKVIVQEQKFKITGSAPSAYSHQCCCFFPLTNKSKNLSNLLLIFKKSTVGFIDVLNCFSLFLFYWFLFLSLVSLFLLD
jgi:hypothetical protein